ncbi:NAD(P)-binding Rossmann-fold superfamily protein [Striga asiatica]|uniref:Dihydroflavonol 4-reductase n=1 Tax=Striga asiatica TaxID=4170 RepID=A0A5A7RBD1_STRAF|nr:NAD(P)-binding Rossmann-fold superfamily protein [Striga asiatica]
MKTVCVTGASGYIAPWIVKFLLLRGYIVKASIHDPKKTDHLLALDGANERLHLIKADLLQDGSFDALVNGCDVLFNGKHRTPQVVVDETWWSDKEFCRKIKKWYFLSKTLAEDAAWKFVQEKGIDMISINPAMVIGPSLQPNLNLTSAVSLNLINGAETYPNAAIGWVNVKDVATAHIQAFENPSANGRYCVVERVAHYSEIVKILHELYPNLQLPEMYANNKPCMPTYQVSSPGIEFTPLRESIKETVDSLKEKNHFKTAS